MSALAFLASPEAFALRREHAAPPGTPFDPVRLAVSLRRLLPAGPARALAEQIELERRAATKFADPSPMLFERIALEQATSPGCAARHVAATPEGAAVVDLGCGLGADALALAAAGRRVVAVDRDPARAGLARHNLGTLERVCAIAVVGEAAAVPGQGDVLFVDPDRRPGSRGRVFSLDDTSPSLATIEAAAGFFDRVLVKAPPAVSDEEIPADARVEFLSEGGECREALLHLRAGGGRFAVHTETGEMRAVEYGLSAPEETPGRFLLDPDPALRRAGGVDGLANELGAARVAAGSTYLWADAAPVSVWVRTYPVLDVFPYRPRDLARALAAEPPGSLVVKQRGVGLPEAAIRRGLPGRSGGPERVLVLFPRGRARIVAVCGSPLPAG